MTEEERYVQMLTGFLYGTDDGRRPIRGRLSLITTQRQPPAEVPMIPSGRGVTVDAGTPGERTAELFAIEAAQRTADERLRIAARQFRHRGGGGIEFA